MLTIKVSSGNKELSELLLRQTPGGNGIWGNCQFLVNQPVEKCDWWVVCHNSGLSQAEETLCDPDHLVFISMEPSDNDIPKGFLSQFSKLVLCDRNVVHSDIVYQNGLTWWVGMNVRVESGHYFDASFNQDYDSFKRMTCPEKKHRISVVCTNQRTKDGHKKRTDFLDKIKANPIGNYVDIFGGGFQAIPDKWDAIAPYKYHIVLENSVVPDYWSEKLADSFLGFAFPIYFGCPNIADYFSPDALQLIDINDFDKSIAVISELLEHDPYQNHLPEIVKARQQILNDYNIFQLMADLCDKPSGRFVKSRLKPSSYFERSWPRRIARKVIYRLRGIQGE